MSNHCVDMCSEVVVNHLVVAGGFDTGRSAGDNSAIHDLQDQCRFVHKESHEQKTVESYTMRLIPRSEQECPRETSFLPACKEDGCDVSLLMIAIGAFAKRHARHGPRLARGRKAVPPQGQKKKMDGVKRKTDDVGEDTENAGKLGESVEMVKRRNQRTARTAQAGRQMCTGTRPSQQGVMADWQEVKVETERKNRRRES
ncbi:hypothetical protein WN55_06661 [Dufourea novaeangliae]|uniref:Uncharacterized protein n=1 Tax=Dufourea novaeangliae TaxID=178035 RepID=A0A154P218_DUFNO|nr:hypothetical protein WN55_06661 [Dufourea novaeangliae]